MVHSRIGGVRCYKRGKRREGGRAVTEGETSNITSRSCLPTLVLNTFDVKLEFQATGGGCHGERRRGEGYCFGVKTRVACMVMWDCPAVV